MRRHSREAEDLEGIPVVHSIQGHDHLEYAEKVLVMTWRVDERMVDELGKNENSEVNVHLPGCCGSVVSEANTGLMKTHKQLAFNRQVNGGLNDHGQYIEPTV